MAHPVGSANVAAVGAGDVQTPETSHRDVDAAAAHLPPGAAIQPAQAKQQHYEPYTAGPEVNAYQGQPTNLPQTNEFNNPPARSQVYTIGGSPQYQSDLQRHDSNYGHWMEPAAAGAGGALAGVAGTEAYRHQQQQQEQNHVPTQYASNPEPQLGVGANAPVLVDGLSKPESSAVAKDFADVPAGAPSQDTIPASVNNVGGEYNLDNNASTFLDGSKPVHSTSSHIGGLPTPSHLHIPGEYPPTPAV